MSMFGDVQHPVSEGTIRQMVLDKDLDLLSTNMLNALRSDTLDLILYHTEHHMEVGDEEFDEIRLLDHTLYEIDFILHRRETIASDVCESIRERYHEYERARRLVHHRDE